MVLYQADQCSADGFGSSAIRAMACIVWLCIIFCLQHSYTLFSAELITDCSIVRDCPVHDFSKMPTSQSWPAIDSMSLNMNNMFGLNCLKRTFNTS